MIDQSSINNWKEDEITQKVFELLTWMNDVAEATIMNPELVYSVNGVSTIAANHGIREVVNRILNIKLDDLIDTTEKIENEKA